MKRLIIFIVVLWSMSAGAQRKVTYSGYNSTDKGVGMMSVSDQRSKKKVQMNEDSTIDIGEMWIGNQLVYKRYPALADIEPITYRWYNDDSAKQRVSGIILKGRESDIVCYIVKTNQIDFPIMDSVIKAIYVVKPGNGQNVTFNDIPNKEWMRMFKKMQNLPIAIIKNSFSNLMTELLLHGSSWIIYRVNIEVAQSEVEFDDMKKLGQDYAQKKDEGGY